MPAPPNRTVPGDFHYHIYDYINDNADPDYALSAGFIGAVNMQFHSLGEDLQSLHQEAQIKNIHNPVLAQLGGAGVTTGGRDIFCLEFGGIPPGAGGGAVMGPAVLLTGGIHAREWIAVEVTYLIAEYLIKNYPAPAAITTANEDIIKNIVDTRRIHIAPMLNPDGNMRTVTNERLWRKNRNPLNVGNFYNDVRAVPNPFRNFQNNANDVQYNVNYFPAVTDPTSPLFGGDNIIVRPSGCRC